MASLWGGRFEKEMDDIVKQFNASIGFDQRMYNEDIDGSIAHVTMLGHQGIVSEDEAKQIVDGLEKIRGKIKSGEIVFDIDDEDIHMGIESRLIADIGDVGKKLHTARSRNDQCQIDMRLYLKKEIKDIAERLIYLEEVILSKAEQYADSITVGFTHIQHAQPITIGFIFMAYFQMFRRDLDRLAATYERMNLCPLGACALAGTTLPTDRKYTAQLLGFAAPTENAMDSVSDRDYVIEFESDAAISMMHISRWAEEFVWWNSQEFGFIDIDDSYCTGSSIMPQKKNPDMAELLRGKSGRVYGDLVQMLTIMKGTPLAYNKDFQEDKEGLYDVIDTWKASITIFANMLEKTEFRMDRIEQHFAKGFLNATDIAEHFANAGIPFREAHSIVGRMVKMCEVKNCDFEDLTDEDLQSIDQRVNKETLGDISMKACVDARVSYGGTAPSEVRRQISVGESWLNGIKEMVW
ncbi:MAG: argininosuccinate lyase [Eubacteriaceae bacterium]|nr:argininosuccinate lyase [Eubacteriaceae bacterium]